MPGSRRAASPDKRGSAPARRARKLRMLKLHGDGTTAPCSWCGKRLYGTTMQQDRIVAGGAYVVSNLVPACGPCNRDRCDLPFWEYFTKRGSPPLALTAILRATRCTKAGQGCTVAT